MKEEITLKEIPEYIVYYKEGTIEDYSKLPEFIVQSGAECLELNPGIECVSADYCYVNYLDGEYKEKNIKVRYVQAVTNKGNSNESIKFMTIDKVKAVCVYHKGSYSTIKKTYQSVMEYIEKNNYEIIDFPRECYIDGCWNKDNQDDYLTEIEVPVK